ncbi:nucleotide-binding protein [Virgisporangium aurantiacum]|uniref:CD-NTase-associated protein 12/Pycsar effector protein TIR domain-containing protein n=1 Tax=Virgisporangium aurantiacum TaxID=175570 RepID=A0A8J4E6Z7_9ACTN|nr:nucleotide-binding protein [Virgisporangium aurantiacum]GIJ63643.1 hypothetical protein Vau01_111590 [Virgisporangium aurantiacum]
MDINGHNIVVGTGRAGDKTVNNYGSAGPPPPEGRTANDGGHADRSRRVFVVFGRDRPVRDRMFDFLRALGLEPLEWERIINEARHAAPYIGEVVARGVTQASAVLVLLTPDDVVHLHPSLHEPGEGADEVWPTCQPRPNALIELGMALATFPTSTVIVTIGTLRPFSDLAGRDVVRFDGSFASVQQLLGRLRAAGLPARDDGSDWYRADRFANWDAYLRRPRPPTV